MINHYHNNWWYNLNYNLYHKWIYNFILKWFTIGARHGLFIDSPRHAHGTQFLASIKCICIVEFCLSFLFYFIRQIFYCCVGFCRILSDFVESFVYCIQYTSTLYIAYIIISWLRSIQYFFLIHLTKYINYVLRTLFLIY